MKRVFGIWIAMTLYVACTQKEDNADNMKSDFDRSVYRFRPYISKVVEEELVELSVNRYDENVEFILDVFLSGLAEEEVRKIGRLNIRSRELKELIDFSKFINLEDLVLSFNKIDSLDEFGFGDRLKYLSLGNNIRLTELIINKEYDHIVSLNAMKCSIQRIEGFQNFNSLQYLDLRQNPIENIEEVLSIPNSSMLEITLSIVHGLEINRVDAFLRNALVKFGKFDITIDDRGNLTDESTMYNIREENDIKRFINAYEKIAG